MPLKRSNNSRSPQLTNHLLIEPTAPPPTATVIKRHILRNFILGSLWGIVFLVIIVTAVFTASMAYYLHTFSAAAQIPPFDIVKTISDGIQQTPTQSDGRVNILVLGTDETANRVGEKILTDTILLLSMDLEKGKLYGISIPRDTWDAENTTKINGLYQQGLVELRDRPEQKPTEVLETLTGVDIHHTVIVSMENIAELVDLVGGIDVEIPETFTDDLYPRDNVDIKTITDPKILYESVTFTQGTEKMTGERALKYIRSRKSTTISQGSDDARVLRQQQVILALMKKVLSPQILREPTFLGSMYGYYLNNFKSYIEPQELVAIGFTLNKNIQYLRFEPETLSIRFGAQPGVLFHPPQDTFRGWIYEIVDKESFQDEISTKLKLK